MIRHPDLTNRLLPSRNWFGNLALCLFACIGISLVAFGCVPGENGAGGVTGFTSVPNANEVQRHLAAAEANRLRLWSELKNDELLIPQADFEVLKELYGQSTFLSAQIAVGLEGEDWPPVELVEEWMVRGQLIYDGVDDVMTRIGGDLSVSTRSAWAVEQVRLRKLNSIGQAYRDNPNAQTYQQLLKVGIIVGRSVLGAALF